MYPLSFIDKVIKKFLDDKFSANRNQSEDMSKVYYFKLPYIGEISVHIYMKLSKLSKQFWKEKFTLN